MIVIHTQHTNKRNQQMNGSHGGASYLGSAVQSGRPVLVCPVDIGPGFVHQKSHHLQITHGVCACARECVCVCVLCLAWLRVEFSHRRSNASQEHKQNAPTNHRHLRFVRCPLTSK